MTRENKLALVVGFGLILFIGILISDHFSVARNQTSANLTSREIADPLVGRSRNEPDLIAIKPEPPPVTAPLLHPADAAMNTAQMASTGATNQPIETMSPEQRSGIARDVNLAPGTHDNQGRGVPRDVEPVNTLAPQSGSAEFTALNGRPDDVPELPGFVKISDETQVNMKDLRFHDVRGGESLFAICKQYYGSTDLVKALAKFNKMDDPAQLRAGRRLIIPTEETLTGKPKAPPPSTPQTPSNSALRNTAMAAAATRSDDKSEVKKPKPASRTYTVKSGDSLSDIAQRMLGDKDKWRDLAKINRKVIDDPDNIKAGTVLKLG